MRYELWVSVALEDFDAKVSYQSDIGFWSRPDSLLIHCLEKHFLVWSRKN